MRRASYGAPLALAIALLAGCGGSSSSSRADAVTKTYITYIEAVKSGDGKTACRQLTPAFKAKAASLTTPSARAKVKGASCPEAIRLGTLRGALTQFEPKLERVAVSGRRASGFQPGEGALGPQKVFFRRLAEGWRIAGVIYQKGGPKLGA
jgi:hypothetical protein